MRLKACGLILKPSALSLNLGLSRRALALWGLSRRFCGPCGPCGGHRQNQPIADPASTAAPRPTKTRASGVDRSACPRTRRRHTKPTRHQLEFGWCQSTSPRCSRSWPKSSPASAERSSPNWPNSVQFQPGKGQHCSGVDGTWADFDAVRHDFDQSRLRLRSGT